MPAPASLSKRHANPAFEIDNPSLVWSQHEDGTLSVRCPLCDRVINTGSKIKNIFPLRSHAGHSKCKPMTRRQSVEQELARQTCRAHFPASRDTEPPRSIVLPSGTPSDFLEFDITPPAHFEEDFDASDYTRPSSPTPLASSSSTLSTLAPQLLCPGFDVMSLWAVPNFWNTYPFHLHDVAINGGLRYALGELRRNGQEFWARSLRCRQGCPPAKRRKM
ncbi:hypothetical protein HGRIS_012901 [Hohenbuehelia grisea]|uniref:Uncharacterized protein n=1 Tax=Hohenbuehelia grisea TaxID=104357 RepID=A0ABR3ITS4_9AGAR